MAEGCQLAGVKSEESECRRNCWFDWIFALQCNIIALRQY
ncbi:hypothetical protein CAter282_0607 [Collimonas arenae]|uniref:Uncharacterized protein n=1 Tax=Collimonas arenae TaxID=279058 RepID=A0A127PL65_9BURK|nr:hypothetical protein CAter10_0646 [Collimonas arenae]AMP08416.1 hypothetical protein CAter282_0607 [Collimonas arenae]